LWRRRPLMALVYLSLLVAYLLFFATFMPWRASHFGNRYLFIPVMASVLPLAALLHRVGHRKRVSTRRSAAVVTGSPAVL
jgi:hypothetical protein